MWKPGEIIAWRGIFRERLWHAVPTTVVKDTSQEIVLALMPGAECMVEENYARYHKKSEKRRWDFLNEDWKLEKFTWHTNRLLHVIQADKYYSTVYFWHHESNKFECYYINFQLPFKRNHCSIDTLDLDLDIVIYPDFSFEWKDMDDYQRAIEAGVILPEWAHEIEIAKAEVLNRLEKRDYPFDNSWLNWQPDSNWSTPKLPDGWDRI